MVCSRPSRTRTTRLCLSRVPLGACLGRSTMPGKPPCPKHPATLHISPHGSRTTNTAPKYLKVSNAPPMRRSEEHTSELQSLMRISYAVFCLKKNNTQTKHTQQ